MKKISIFTMLMLVNLFTFFSLYPTNYGATYEALLEDDALHSKNDSFYKTIKQLVKEDNQAALRDIRSWLKQKRTYLLNEAAFAPEVTNAKLMALISTSLAIAAGIKSLQAQTAKEFGIYFYASLLSCPAALEFTTSAWCMSSDQNENRLRLQMVNSLLEHLN